MPINTLISAVMRWAERTFATRGEVGATVDAAVAKNAPDWNAAEGEPGHIANKPEINGITAGTGTNAEVFNGEYTNTATGNYSHAEGYGTTASSAYDHSEGQSTTASGGSSHAEGYSTTASGPYSHAEGCQTTASAAGSHAEGNETSATAPDSHAEGNETIASGSASHAGGYSTEAAAWCQHVIGKWNVVDRASYYGEQGVYVHIVGNGKSNSKRSNAHTLDWSGNAWFAGTVEGTALILKSPDGSRYQVTVGNDGTISAAKL